MKTPRFLPAIAVLAVSAANAAELPFSTDFDAQAEAPWDAYGGEWSTSDSVLSVRAGDGPKAVVRDLTAADFQLSVDVRLDSPDAQAGVIFRAEGLGEGADAHEGYYAGLHAGDRGVVWGAHDPDWREIASRPAPIRADTWYRLRLEVAGENVRVFINETPVDREAYPVFDGVDGAFERGAVGLRALGGGASFRDLEIRAHDRPDRWASYTNPVRDGCADPVVLKHGGKYYAYCTYTPDHPRMPRGIRLYTSDNLVDWEDEGFVLEDDDTWGDSRFWAPDIVEKDGTFHLYYAADERMCVATADSPLGPFRQDERKPMEPDSIRIDGHIFEDDDGRRYFYYVTFNDGNEIWGGRLNDDMTSVDEDSLRMMVKPDQPWERHMAPITEGAEVIKHEGTYYLTYSGSHFESPEYAVGYATSDSPLGPWKKYEHNPIMKSTAYAHGTAHHCLTTSPDGTERFIVYHRHHSLTETEPRRMAIDRIRFAPREDGPDVLEVHGPTASPQPLPSGSPATR